LRQWFPFQEVHTRIPFELMAWIIGWALIMEYAIGNITVAHILGDYLRVAGQWRHLPQWVQMDYLTASTGYRDAT
jgi:amino acid transporter